MSSTLEQRKQRLLRFKGAMAAVITPFDRKGELDVSQIDQYVKFLVDNKVDGVYIIGTTGEGYNLTNDERLTVAKAWRRALDSQKADLLAVVNVSSYCAKEAQLLAKQVDSLGFDAIAVLPANYYRPANIQEWVDYLKLFCRSAPNTPLLYYHIPSMIGEFNFDIVDAIGEGIKQIPQLAAMKFTDNNVVRFTLIQKRYSHCFKVLIGFDEMLLTALTSLACDAGICALFNLPEVVDAYKKLVAHVDRSDLDSARREQSAIVDECVKHKTSGNFFLSIKQTFNSIVKPLGLDFGYPRPPISYHYNWL
ncbi:N-acetylneuraminate lyase B-like [Oppia nitens]|uniref:N-acetylneuraminate lyase B-like n=1 Tax=Oppia nitens TaxID=1686743 RepID=UPI0023D98525|nr:N-acetylneuraminate lyase B-like [Oppia nitens]